MKDKFSFAIWAAYSILAASSAFSQDALSNESILRMVRAQMADNIIVRLIASEPGRYITTSEALIALRREGVSNQVIAALLNRTSSVSPGSPDPGSVGTEISGAAASSMSSAAQREASPGPAMLPSGRLGLTRPRSEGPISDDLSRPGREIPTRTAGPAILEEGAAVRLRLLRTVSSATARVGDKVRLEVLDDVDAGEILVIPRGAKVVGSVTQAQHNRRFGLGGKFGLSIDWVQLPDGSQIPLRADGPISGSRLDDMRSSNVYIKAPLAWSAVPLVMVKGREAVLARGTEVTAYTDSDVPVSRTIAAAGPASFTGSATTKGR